MNKTPRLVSLIAALVIGLCLSASSAWAEGTTPESVAKNFTKAYYMLDESMADYLSADALVNENDVDMVELFLRLKEENARNRGYKMSYLQMHPILLKTEVLEQTEDSATIRLDTTALRSINPLFRIVGYIFGLIQEHEFETTLSLVNEEGVWKVGPGALNPLG